MGQPNRHGHGGWSGVPVPIGVGTPAAGRSSSSAGPDMTPVQQQPLQRVQVVSVKSVNAFLEALPQETVQHLAVHTTQPYNPTTTVGAVLKLQSQVVPDGQVWVLTDVRFFALAPSTGLQTPPTLLAPENLLGLIRFDIHFAGRTPLKLEGTFYSVYAGASATALQVGTRSGWLFAREDFGTQRELSFALYAQEGDQIDAVANVDIVPRFPLAALGVEMHGFSIPTSFLSRIWGKGGNGG